MAAISISTFTQTGATGTYDPEAASVTYSLVKVDTSEEVASGDAARNYPNWSCSFDAPTGVLLKLTATVNDGENTVSTFDEKTF